jgi:hypothetical protein
MTSGWLEPFEKLTLWFFLTPLILVWLHDIYHRLTVPELRWKAPLILLISAVTMSQVNINQNTEPLTQKYKGWWSMGVNGSLGKFPEKRFDCNGKLKETIVRDYSTWGVGIAYHNKPKMNHHLTAGINAYSATDLSDDPDEIDYRSPALNVFVSYDTRYVGGNIGVNYFFDQDFNIGYITPTIDLWMGMKDMIFGEFKVMTDYYLIGRPGLIQVGVGSGFGQVDRSMGRAGLCIEPGGWFGDQAYISGGYFAGDILIKKIVTLKPTLFVGSEIGGSLGLQLHLGKGRWKAKANEL